MISSPWRVGQPAPASVGGAGFAVPSWVSLESVSLPGSFVRQSLFQMVVQPNDGTAQFRVDDDLMFEEE